MKAQISTEYLIILGIAIAAIIPAGYFFYTYSTSTNDQSVRSQIETIGNEIIVNAESVYGLAEGSLVSLDVKYPDGIIDVYVMNHNELIISYRLSSGPTEAVFFSKTPISGEYQYPLRISGIGQLQNSTFTDKAPTQGKKTLRFESKTSYTLITTQ
ncbi:MAG: hypothetical protein ACP5NV_05470 [Candidatus Woesearchaeota archaeon]